MHKLVCKYAFPLACYNLNQYFVCSKCEHRVSLINDESNIRVVTNDVEYIKDKIYTDAITVNKRIVDDLDYKLRLSNRLIDSLKFKYKCDFDILKIEFKDDEEYPEYTGVYITTKIK